MPADVGARIRITHANLDPGRTGTVTQVVTSDNRDLFTVRLDRGGWPGGHDGSHSGHGHTGKRLGAWNVELRADEFEVI